MVAALNHFSKNCFKAEKQTTVNGLYRVLSTLGFKYYWYI